MIFVDANVFMYAVGTNHPLRDRARNFIESAPDSHQQLCTSAEVLQELLHVYLRLQRPQFFEHCMKTVQRLNILVWPLEYEDVLLAGQLHNRHPALSARDLCHLASCRRRGIRNIKTFDRALAAAFE